MAAEAVTEDHLHLQKKLIYMYIHSYWISDIKLWYLYLTPSRTTKYSNTMTK
jgi:hypothetical protein